MRLEYLSLVLSVLGAVPVIQAIFKSMRFHIKSFLRGSKMRELCRIRALRHNVAEINYLSSSANSHKVLFILLTCLLFLVLDLSERVWTQESMPVVPVFTLFFSVFIFEVSWLNKRDFARKLLKAHGKLILYRRKLC